MHKQNAVFVCESNEMNDGTKTNEDTDILQAL